MRKTKAHPPVDPQDVLLDSEEFARTTIVLPATIDQNLQILSLQKNTSKNEVVKEALREYLRAQGLRPDEKPRLSISY